MRAVQPARSGSIDRDGDAIHYEVYGDGEPTVYLLMPDTIVQSRGWKAQIPFLSRFFRVVVSDPRGNGLSGFPTDAEGYGDRVLIDDAWAVLDEVGSEQAVLVGLCTGAGYVVFMAAEAPERVLGICAINPGLQLSPPLPHKVEFDFDAPRDTYEGWQKMNRHYWLRNWPDFSRFFFAEMFPEPHSTKQREDCVEWALQTTPEAMILAGYSAPYPGNEPDTVAAARAVRCPVLVITGSLDRCQNPVRSERLAEITGGEHGIIEGGGHLPQARDPVKVNLLLREFITRCARR
jgi:pimeloyl-ACP methyl ester carboxylesterase